MTIEFFYRSYWQQPRQQCLWRAISVHTLDVICLAINSLSIEATKSYRNHLLFFIKRQYIILSIFSFIFSSFWPMHRPFDVRHMIRFRTLIALIGCTCTWDEVNSVPVSKCAAKYSLSIYGQHFRQLLGLRLLEFVPVSLQIHFLYHIYWWVGGTIYSSHIAKMTLISNMHWQYTNSLSSSPANWFDIVSMRHCLLTSRRSQAILRPSSPKKRKMMLRIWKLVYMFPLHACHTSSFLHKSSFTRTYHLHRLGEAIST